MSRTAAARSAPTRAAICSNVMFSSWCPASALVAGVKIGSGSFEARFNPGGSGTPQTLPLALYSFQPEPSR